MSSHFVSPYFLLVGGSAAYHRCRVVEGYQRTSGSNYQICQTEQERAVIEGTLECDLLADRLVSGRQSGSYRTSPITY